MENGVKLRAYRDGDDFVVYFENCSTGMEAFLKNMLNPLMEKDSRLEPVEKLDADPVVPQGCGKYSGMHVSEVFLEYGNQGYATIAFILGKGMFSGSEADVRELLSQYLFDTFSSIDPQEYAGNMDEEQADEWLKCFDSLITANQKQDVKNLTGFESFEQFLKSGTKEQKITLIYNIIMNMGYFD